MTEEDRQEEDYLFNQMPNKVTDPDEQRVIRMASLFDKVYTSPAALVCPEDVAYAGKAGKPLSKTEKEAVLVYKKYDKEARTAKDMEILVHLEATVSQSWKAMDTKVIDEMIAKEIARVALEGAEEQEDDLAVEDAEEQDSDFAPMEVATPETASETPKVTSSQPGAASLYTGDRELTVSAEPICIYSTEYPTGTEGNGNATDPPGRRSWHTQTDIVWTRGETPQTLGSISECPDLEARIRGGGPPPPAVVEKHMEVKKKLLDVQYENATQKVNDASVAAQKDIAIMNVAKAAVIAARDALKDHGATDSVARTKNLKDRLLEERQAKVAANITAFARGQAITAAFAARDACTAHDDVIKAYYKAKAGGGADDTTKTGKAATDGESNTNKRKRSVNSARRPSKKAASTSTKTRRRKPGVAALRQIQKLQKTGETIFPKATMKRLIREIATNFATNGEIRFRVGAFEAIHCAAEEHLLEIFQVMVLIMANAGRTTVMDKDLITAGQILPGMRDDGIASYAKYGKK